MNVENIVPITDAKARLPELVRTAESEDVFIVRHGRPAAVLIGVDRYEAMLDRVEDLEDRLSVYEARDGEPTIELGKLKAELGI